jgi:5-methylcytosine-specific restriction endonuclease McrA
LKKGVQTAICCPCGNEKILALGLCATCYTLKRQDAEYFGGLREQVLERDGYACRVCGDPEPGVHHRKPGRSVLHLMIALCAGCHAKVHRTKVVLTEFPPLLLVLWRERHPESTNRRTLISTSESHRLKPCPSTSLRPRKNRQAPAQLSVWESRV